MDSEAPERDAQAPRKMLKWAGSKTNSSTHIIQHLALDRPYIEPFCGSAAFYFENLPQRAILNDLNSHLIDCYKAVKHSPKEVWEYYDTLAVSEDNYYAVRSSFNISSRSIKKSAQFLYLNHYCFNGIYRTNRTGLFNTPYGAKKKQKRKFTLNDFMYFSRTLQNVSLHSRDFAYFLEDLDPVNSCIYMDPPYFTVEGRVFNEYDAKIFAANDLKRLHDLALSLSSSNIVVVSYKDCGEFRELFDEFIISPFMVMRNVGGFAGRRKSDLELVAVLGR